MSDAAPATTGNRTVDRGRSYTLAETILYIAMQHLVPGGNFVVKVFQSGDENELLQVMRSSFTKAKKSKALLGPHTPL